MIVPFGYSFAVALAGTAGLLLTAYFGIQLLLEGPKGGKVAIVRTEARHDPAKPELENILVKLRNHGPEESYVGVVHICWMYRPKGMELSDSEIDEVFRDELQAARSKQPPRDASLEPAHEIHMAVGELPRVNWLAMTKGNASIYQFCFYCYLDASCKKRIIKITHSVSVLERFDNSSFSSTIIKSGTDKFQILPGEQMADSTKNRFDRLLKAMAEGEAPSAQKTPSGEAASDAEHDACCSDTRTPPDTSGDASR
jgi:hypothetical protein